MSVLQWLQTIKELMLGIGRVPAGVQELSANDEYIKAFPEVDR